VRRRANDIKDDLKVAALNVASVSGFTPSSGTLTLHNPPATGLNITEENAVEVILFESKPRLLSSIFSDAPVKIYARAVATVVGGSPACVLGLANTDPTMVGAITVTGSASVTLNNCNASTNSAGASSFYLQGSGKLHADCASTVGGADTGAGLNLECGSEVITQAPPVMDPYRNAPWPTPTVQCKQETKSNVTTIWIETGHTVATCNLSGLKGEVKIGKGRYVIPSGGEFSAEAQAKVTGTDVTFFFKDSAKLNINGSADLILSAPTASTDPYGGILFFGDSTPQAEGLTHQMLGSSDSFLTGAIYMPKSNVIYQGTSTVAGSCLQIIANQVTFTGNTTIELGASCTGAGTKPLLTGQIIKIIE
jgi:hypothetical protein